LAKKPDGHAHPHDTAAERARVMLERIRASGLKLTPQRMAIVREIAADPTHPTAQELFERLRPALPTMSFATVYNTLDALASAGLCAALALSPGASRFDPNMEPHHHAVCDRCGLVRDVPREPQDEAGEPSAVGDANLHVAAPGFEIRAVERIYRGLCPACAALERKAHARGGGEKPQRPS
jgi:Fur family peroxide stress response transcriptional regulator